MTQRKVSEMDSDDEIVFFESVQRKRTNLVLSDLEEEVSETVVSAGSSTSAAVNVPTTSTVIESTQQQQSQVVLLSATTPKRNNGGKRQRKKRKGTDADNAYSMNFYNLSFFKWLPNILKTYILCNNIFFFTKIFP